jgi:hypothetical protein
MLTFSYSTIKFMLYSKEKERKEKLLLLLLLLTRKEKNIGFFDFKEKK